MSGPVMVADVDSIELDNKFEPFNPEWVIDGQPASRSKALSMSEDRISDTVLWECTAGHFNWHFERDEVIFVLSGEAFLIEPHGRELRFGAGDFGFFPAGTSCTFRVDNHFRKIAVIRETMSRPHAYALKAWKKLLRLAHPFSPAPVPRPRFSSQSPLLQPDLHPSTPKL
jgi:uncharacterized cupin superfamily protein